MSRFELEELSRFGDYTGSQELTDMLVSSEDEHKNRLSDVRVSPDGRHIHIILPEPKVGLVTFDKYERPQPPQNHKTLELCSSPRTVPVVDVCYLDHNNNSRGTAIAAVIYENGKAEFWCFQESKGGWRLLQASDLCNSPRARVVSVCVCSSFIIWCEERPPSESSTRNKLRYCVCRRDFEVEEGAVILAGVKIILHDNPKFTVISSGDYVHLLPDPSVKPLPCIFKFFLTWSPHHDSFTVGAACKNTPIKKLSAKELDFKKLIVDCLGYLSALEPPEICSFSPTGHGGLLLLLSTGWLCLLQKDGTMRQVYKLPENSLVKHGTHTSLCMYINVLALIIGRNLHLIELSCGRELQKIVLKGAGLLYANQTERQTPHLLSETGLFVVADRKAESADCSFKAKPPGFGPAEGAHSGALLIEAVFEEACKYYQQRSLSSTQLTVDALKKGGRFQAPISLASILRGFLGTGFRKKGAEPVENAGGEFNVGRDKLMASLEGELKALVSLEELKGSLVRGGAEEVEAVCETLVEKEVVRLLSSSELDKEALMYLNSIFSIFPCQAWRAAQAALQLHYNGEGSLSSRAPPDVWKTVLSPTLTSSPTASHLFPNGQPKHNHSLKGDLSYRGKASPLSSSVALPVFELLCESVLHFQPTWLPSFLELAQQQQGSAGLGLSLASSSWSFSGGRGGEGGENNVPLYKRALCLLSSMKRDSDQHWDLEVELLLVGGRPNAILQALRILMSERRWERVTQVAQRFCKQSPLLNKEIFTTLLCEVVQHRDLDPYLDLLWMLCPEDFTVTTILNLVLKNLPSPNTSSHPLTFSMSHTNSSSSPPPFADPQSSSQLTIGLLKPLLRKVLQRETKPSQHYVDILQSPSYPPPALPRQPTEQPSSVTDSAPCSSATTALCAETPEQQPSTHTTAQRSSAALPAAPLGFT
ncbi:Hermansky-Pudlak syndrome 6 protein homolog [Kryptolebias marmoratus]|uniref:Hermansky-Pudlak syndrome 6 protein homolog n=1 Tax=Kryptolebias marmoratus TaxID=37003 RepID=UPI0007F9310F|nr:Hermansky-Pudlak syndrome 6 protein homolog [Kryptolebias marmoratus]